MWWEIVAVRCKFAADCPVVETKVPRDKRDELYFSGGVYANDLVDFSAVQGFSAIRVRFGQCSSV